MNLFSSLARTILFVFAEILSKFAKSRSTHTRTVRYLPSSLPFGHFPGVFLGNVRGRRHTSVRVAGLRVLTTQPCPPALLPIKKNASCHTSNGRDRYVAAGQNRPYLLACVCVCVRTCVCVCVREAVRDW